VLGENHAELAQTMQDAFDDAVLMAWTSRAMRKILVDMVQALTSPKRPGRQNRMTRHGVVLLAGLLAVRRMGRACLGVPRRARWHLG